MNKIAVLLTCFNRGEITSRCLSRLFFLSAEIDVYLVDDGSTDGTSETIKQKYPMVHLVQGNGNLFWSRGMYEAWNAAKVHSYSYYIWLNDDMIIYDHCFDELLTCSKLSAKKTIISGIVESHDKKEILYGGTDKEKKLLKPNGAMQEIQNMNGNVVLIPDAVFKILGNLDPVYHHDLGDVDYGLRARREGINVVTTRTAIGSCDRNNFCRVRLWNANIVKRFQKLYTPLGNNPVINFYFRRKHYGIFNAAGYYVFLHVLNLMPDYFVKLLFGNKYVSD